MIALIAATLLAVTPMNPDEVLATVNGTQITRRDLETALTGRAQQEYRDAMDDLVDLERSAVRDYVGRQCIATQAQQQKTTPDAIYQHELATDFERLDPNMRNRIESGGGTLTSASTPGRGTRVEAWLPAARQPVESRG